MTITAISALHDNYIWVITHRSSRYAVAVDPGDAKPLKAWLAKNQLILEAILLTHHHYDHSDGITELKESYPDLIVYGPKDARVTQLVTHPVSEGDNVYCPNTAFSAKVLDVPAHTKSHIAFYNDTLVFTGDTLFSAGCGRLFEGTPEMMFEALNKLASLPDSTAVYCGHEYTRSNLAFAKAVEPNNPAIDSHLSKLKGLAPGTPSLPSSIGLEKQINPFLRTDQPALLSWAKSHYNQAVTTRADVLGALRTHKDKFKN